MALKLKVTKAKMVRKIENQKVEGFYGRVITNGKLTFADIARESAQNTTLHRKEAEFAANLLIDGITARIKEGYIIDLGPLGTLYPAVSGKWEQDPDNLSLADMTPKVNYKPSDDIASAVRGATLQWTAEPSDDDDDNTPDPTPNNGNGNGGDDNDDELEG